MLDKTEITLVVPKPLPVFVSSSKVLPVCSMYFMRTPGCTLLHSVCHNCTWAVESFFSNTLSSVFYCTFNIQFCVYRNLCERSPDVVFYLNHYFPQPPNEHKIQFHCLTSSFLLKSFIFDYLPSRFVTDNK